MPIFNNILAGAAGQTGGAAAGYEIERSLRFNSADSAYLDRTPSSAGNRKTWTWSGWVKQSDVSTGYQHLFVAGTGVIARIAQNPGSNRRIHFTSFNGSTFDWGLVTTAEFRDPSAWYHIVFVLDTTQATASDRAKIYVNGVLQTTFNISSYPSQNYEDTVNNTVDHRIGEYTGSSFPMDGYLADVHFIDGQALAPTDFGEFDANNVWQPKAYSGTYGTNGFHLDFSDNSSTTSGSNTGIGKDTSGNGNYFDSNNISVASGVGNDSLLDSPTNYDDGTNVGGNYATLNPLDINGSTTLSNGNLFCDKTGTTGYGLVKSSIAVSSGKWYCEYTLSGVGQTVGITLASHGVGDSDYLQSVAGGVGYYSVNGQAYTNSGGSTYGDTFTTGDTIGIALDLDNGKVFFSKNGTFQNSGDPAAGTNPAASSLSGNYVFGRHGDSQANTTADGHWNFGQRPFAYTPPTGFKSLCTTNLPDPDPAIADGSTAMDVKLYTGNGSTQTISGLSFSPDLLWIKNRGSAGRNTVEDTVRGATKNLFTDQNYAEETDSNSITAFTSDGFSLGNNTTGSSNVNVNNNTYVAWTWDAGTSTDTNNTDGTIISQVRANQSVGFSIVTATQGSGDSTWGHGLNAKPDWIVMKARDAAYNWYVSHSGLENQSTKFLYLNTTASVVTNTNWFASTEPTNSVVTTRAGGMWNDGDSFVAYCWTAVEGYSAFGSYTGNGDPDGPFVYTGFAPKWILLKESSVSGNNWNIYDTTRNTYNVADLQLKASSSGNEVTNTFADFLSNGFKIRAGTSGLNTDTQTFIYAAFAEHPFKTARAR